MKARWFVVVAMLNLLLFSSCSDAAARSKVTYLLTVEATPKDSQIRIVKPKKTYKPGIKLEPGTYEIYVSHPGYEPKKTSVTIGSPVLPGEPQIMSGTSEVTVRVDLEKSRK